MASLGELYFALGLDDKQFNDALEAAKRKVSELGADVNVTFKMDGGDIARQVREQLDKLQGSAEEKTVKVSFELTHLDNLEKQIRETEERLQKGLSMKFVNQSEIDRTKDWLEQLKSQKRLENEIANDLRNIQDRAGLQYGIKLGDDILSGLKERLLKGERPSELIVKQGGGGTKPLKLDVELNNESVEKVKERLAALVATTTIHVQLDEPEEKATPGTGGRVQHVIDESDIAEVKALSEAMKGLNEQLEIQNRLKQGQIDAAEKNKAERQAKAEERKKEKKALAAGRQAKKDAEAASRAAAKAAKEAASAEQKAAKEQSDAAKESNRALQSQLTQLFRLEEAIRRLKNMRVALDTSDIDKDSENYKKAAAALDAYIDKLEQLQGSGKTLSRRSVSSVLGQDMKAMEAEVKGYLKAQKQMKEGMEDIGDESDSSRSKVIAFGEVLGNVFNYYLIERFVRNLYTIGGEFQKQRIALQAMLGDADKAASIFERTKEMAVVSPFTFSELASYTKQMSAYGLEYEELYDTTKRLADISAGVGVDMGRLILAFGQVRSAAVLRGQELRQFTEAGIPLVNELAKAFSNLENREVKAAEVFDKISRREVSFGMVRDVLFEMTDPGGRFYEMQEELAQSLAGQWSNLKDAWDIMIADIADSTNGPLNTLASVMRAIISGWRLWLPLISGAAVGITALNAGLRITSTLATIGYAGAAAFNPWIAALSAIAALGTGVLALFSSMETATEAQSRLNAEMETSLSKLSENERTANRYLDTLSKTASKEEDKAELLRRQQATLDALRIMYDGITETVKVEELTTEEILRLRQKIAETTAKESEDLLQKNVDSALESLNEARAELEKRKTGTKMVLSTNKYGELTKKEVSYTQYEIQQAEEEVEKLLSLYNEVLSRQKEWTDRRKVLDKEDSTGWREKAEELIKGTTLQAPKEDQSIKEYFNYLKEEYDAAKSEFEIYAENNPITASNKASAKALRDAANRVNIGLGGVSFLQEKKDSGNNKAEQAAKEAAKKDVEAYLEALQNELNRVGSQWDLFKDLLEASGDRTLSANIAFGGQITFDNQLEQLKSRIMEEAKKFGVGINLNDLLGLGEKQLLEQGVSEKAAKAIGALIEAYNKENQKLKDESVRNFIEILNESKDFEQQIADIDRELQKDLADLTANSKGMSSKELERRRAELLKKAEEDKTKVRFEEFKESSDWVKVFDDLDRVSDTTLDNMISKIEEFAKQAHLSEEVTKQLVEAMAKLRDETIERNPFEGFRDAWDRLKNLRDALKRGKMDDGLFYVKQSNGMYKGVTKEEVDNETAEANDDLKDSALGVVDKFKAVADAADLLGGLFVNMGFDMDGLFGKLAEGINAIVSGAQSGASIASAFGATGPWGAIAGAAVGMLSSVFASHDKALQREIEASEARAKEIERMADNIESLLQRTMGGVYTFALDEDSKRKMQDLIEAVYVDDVLGNKKTTKYKLYSEDTRKKAQEAIDEDSYFDAQMAALMASRDELNEQLRLEQKKKNEDATKIGDYEQEIESINIQIEELAKDMANTLYGIDFKDWAGQLAEALVNAWATGEDAVLAYKNTVDDILRDVGVSVISQQLIEDKLKPIMNDFVSQFEKDNGKITDETMSILGRMYGEAEWAAEATGAYLDGLKKLGIDLSESSESSKGGLSKEIQGVTEDTANLLGSYLNAMRQDLSVNRTMIEKLIGDDVPKMNYLAEAQLQQLSMIQQNTKRNADAADKIYDLVNRVVDKGNNRLKV